MTPPDYCKDCNTPHFLILAGHTTADILQFCAKCRDTRPHPKKPDKGDK